MRSIFPTVLASLLATSIFPVSAMAQHTTAAGNAGVGVTSQGNPAAMCQCPCGSPGAMPVAGTLQLPAAGASGHHAALPAYQSGAEHGIRFISGGVGEDDSAAMEAVKAHYNTHLLFADASRGAYLASVEVRIENAKNETVFQNYSSGPYFFLLLPEGHYTIHATHNGVAKSKKVHVTSSKKPGEIKFLWENALGN